MIEVFDDYKNNLDEVYPCLKSFLENEWDALFQEYLTARENTPQNVEEFISEFPDYLQQKFLDDEMPEYFFELAFYELARANVSRQRIENIAPVEGLRINPTAVFLELQYDIIHMLNLRGKSIPQVQNRAHVLSLFKNKMGQVEQQEISHHQLQILNQVEINQLPDKSSKAYEQLVTNQILLID